MEKADKAIALAIDNAARIESTARLLRTTIGAHCVKVMNGNAGSGITLFGEVDSSGAVIVTFTGNSVSLKLNGNTIARGASPIIAEIQNGGEISLNEERANAVALFIGGGK